MGRYTSDLVRYGCCTGNSVGSVCVCALMISRVTLGSLPRRSYRCISPREHKPAAGALCRTERKMQCIGWRVLAGIPREL